VYIEALFPLTWAYLRKLYKWTEIPAILHLIPPNHQSSFKRDTQTSDTALQGGSRFDLTTTEETKDLTMDPAGGNQPALNAKPVAAVGGKQPAPNAQPAAAAAKKEAANTPHPLRFVFNPVRYAILGGYWVWMTLVQWILYLIYLIFSVVWDSFGVKVFILVLVAAGLIGKTALAGLTSELLPPDTTHMKFNFPNAAIQDIQQVHRDVTEVRVLVTPTAPGQGFDIKYLAISNDVRGTGRRETFFSTTEVIQMPVLPRGNWDCGEIKRSQNGKEAVVATTSCEHLAGVEETWHETNIDYLQLEILPIETGTKRVNLVSHPSLDTPGHLAIMKIASFENGIARIEQETRVYKALQGTDAAPKFLGHVTEKGRVIGFLLEYLDGARRISSDDGFYDLALSRCESALEKLHRQGVAHKDAHLGNCFIRKTGEAVWLDFEKAEIVGKGGALDFVSAPNRQFEADFIFLRAHV
jgi:hypothetical protein